MSSPKKDHAFTIMIVGIILILGIAALSYPPFRQAAEMKLSQISGKPAIEIPRNAEPFGELTSYFEKKSITVERKSGLKEYTYYWYNPDLEGAPANIKLPLVLALHGAPGSPYAAIHLLKPENQIAYPAFIMAPVLAAGRLWAAAQKEPQKAANRPLDEVHGLNDTIRMITSLSEQYPIDRSRIYVIGCSDGGTGAFGAVRYFPDVFAGAVALSGYWNPLDAPYMIHTPLWAIHGKHDTVFPAETIQDTVDLIQSYNGPAYYTEISDMGHNCPSGRLYQKPIWDWLFSQQKVN